MKKWENLQIAKTEILSKKLIWFPEDYNQLQESTRLLLSKFLF